METPEVMEVTQTMSPNRGLLRSNRVRGVIAGVGASIFALLAVPNNKKLRQASTYASMTPAGSDRSMSPARPVRVRPTQKPTEAQMHAARELVKKEIQVLSLAQKTRKHNLRLKHVKVFDFPKAIHAVINFYGFEYTLILIKDRSAHQYPQSMLYLKAIPQMKSQSWYELFDSTNNGTQIKGVMHAADGDSPMMLPGEAIKRLNWALDFFAQELQNIK